MKFFNKQTLAFAIVGALATGNALAASADIKSESTIYAKEIALPETLTVPVEWTIGYNFNEQEVRYACIRLTGGATLAGVTPAVFDAASPGGAAATDLTVGSVNYNSGNTVAFFTLTYSGASPVNATADYAIRLANQQVLVNNYSDQVTATVGLYDNPAAAGACAAAGAANPQLIPGTGDTADLIGFEPSFEFVIDPNKATSSVDNTPTSFAGFKFPVTGVSTAANSARLAYAELVQINVGNLRADGNPISLSDIFPTDAILTVEGDFGAWATSTTFEGNAGVKTATSAEFEVDPTNMGGDFVVNANPASDNEIPSGIYTANLTVTPNAGYDLGAGDNEEVVLVPSVDEAAAANDNAVDDGNAIAGQIVQDGVRLQAPLVQVPGGWLSRLVITNTGNKDRTFFLTVQGEDGTAITTGNLNGYVVKAKKTYVIEDMSSVLQGFNAGAKTRGTVIATVAGPEKEIKGLYQIVNTTNMSLSNYVMVNQDSGGH